MIRKSELLIIISSLCLSLIAIVLTFKPDNDSVYLKNSYHIIDHEFSCRNRFLERQGKS